MTAIYPLYKQALMNGDPNVDLDTNTATDGVYCALVNGAYSYSPAHQFYSSLVGIVGVDQRITAPIVSSAGTFDGGDLTYVTVPPGPAVVALVLYRRNAGASGTWRLVFCYDTPGGGLPATPNGGNIQVQWSPSGIFTL